MSDDIDIDIDIDFHIDRLLDKLWHDGEGFFYDALTALIAERNALQEQLSKDKPIEDVIADSRKAVREAAKMRGEEVVYCDACGEDLRGLLKVPFSSLPIDVASANAGESAVLCRDCHVIMIQKMEEEDPDYDDPRGLYP